MKKKFVILISTLTFICVCAISVFAVDYYKDDVDADKWAHSFAVTWRKSMEVTDFSNNCEYFDLLSDFLISEAKNAYSDTVDNVKQSDNQDNTSILVYPKKSPDKSVTSLSYNYGGIKLTIELPENIKACYKKVNECFSDKEAFLSAIRLSNEFDYIEFQTCYGYYTLLYVADSSKPFTYLRKDTTYFIEKAGKNWYHVFPVSEEETAIFDKLGLRTIKYNDSL